MVDKDSITNDGAASTLRDKFRTYMGHIQEDTKLFGISLTEEQKGVLSGTLKVVDELFEVAERQEVVEVQRKAAETLETVYKQHFSFLNDEYEVGSKEKQTGILGNITGFLQDVGQKFHHGVTVVVREWLPSVTEGLAAVNVISNETAAAINASGLHLAHNVTPPELSQAKQALQLYLDGEGAQQHSLDAKNISFSGLIQTGVSAIARIALKAPPLTNERRTMAIAAVAPTLAPLIEESIKALIPEAEHQPSAKVGLKALLAHVADRVQSLSGEQIASIGDLLDSVRGLEQERAALPPNASDKDITGSAAAASEVLGKQAALG